MLYSFAKALLVVFCKILFRLSAEGCENIPKKGGFIVASNHASYLDPIVLGTACPRHLDYMAKRDLFEIKIFGKLISIAGAFPVKRDSPDASALKEAIRRLRSGRAIGMFPEGSRKFDDGSDEPQAGIGFVAIKADVPVIPAFITGADKALPKGAKFIRLQRISVRFGQQIFIERRRPYSDVAVEIMAAIKRLSCS